MQPLHIYEVERGDYKPTTQAELNQKLQGQEFQRFDQGGEFEKWLDKKRSAMDPRIKQAVSDELK